VLSLDLIARLVVAVALLWAGVSKLLSRDSSFLGPYGVPVRWRGPALAALTGVELATGVLLLAGVEGAAVAAVGLGAVFVAALASVRARGVRRLRCGCFGANERSTNLLLGRAVLFTSAAVLIAPLTVGALADATSISAALGVVPVALALAAVGLAAVTRAQTTFAISSSRSSPQ